MRAALTMPRHKRDRAGIRDRHLRRNRAPSSSSSPPVALSSLRARRAAVRCSDDTDRTDDDNDG